jgi:hypothetical protein
MSKTGTMKLPTASAVALFEKELKGQMSDGMWENSRPFDHWKFWSNMDVEHVPGCVPTVETTVSWQCKKNAYSFAALIPIIGERMLSIGVEAIGVGYNLKLMKEDLKAIKAAMKTVIR